MSTASAAAKRKAALEALKAKRSGISVGSNKVSTDQDSGSDSDNDIYDQVTEEEYKSYARGRIMQDDFIEDDDGSGYVDNGIDDWDRKASDEEDEEEDEDSETEQDYYDRTGKIRPKKKSRAKGKPSGKVSQKKSLAKKEDYGPTAGVGLKKSRKDELEAFEKGRNSLKKSSYNKYSKPSLDAYRAPLSKDKEEDFMAKLMNGLDDPTLSTSSSSASNNINKSTNPIASSNLNRKRKPDYTSYGDGSFSNFRKSSGNSSPSTGPSSDDHAPSSDGIQPPPSVHVSGSDSPPWKSNLNKDDYDVIEDDGDLRIGSQKKFRSNHNSLPKRIGSLGLGKDLFPSVTSRENQVDSMDLDQEFNFHSDDEDEEFDIKAPGAFTGKQKLVNASSIKTSSEPQPPMMEEKPVISNHLHQSSTASPSMILDNQDEEKKLNSKSKLINGSWKKINQGSDLVSTVESVDSSTPLPIKGGAQNRRGNKPGQGSSTASVETASATSQVKINAIEKDGSLPFFWYDHAESDGKLTLFGKVKDKDNGKFVSASVVVEGIERCLFVLPRAGKKIKNVITKEVPTQDEVEEEFESIKEKNGIKNTMCKWVKRKYAFELPGVPSEAEYLKVRYGFDEPILPLNTQGSTIERVFGTNTNLFELFVVKNGIMGPCWLNVKNVTPIYGEETTSLSRVEVRIDDPKDARPFSNSNSSSNNESSISSNSTNPIDCPPLTVMSLSTRTVVNHKENKREIVSISARIWKDYQLNDLTEPERLPSFAYTVVRPLGTSFPPGFEKRCQNPIGDKDGLKTKITTMKNERLLLNNFLVQFGLYDPDVIVGHEFTGASLDVLLHRMKDLNITNKMWSKLGKIKRKNWPRLSQGFNVGLLSGRLIADLSSDTGKSIISSTTWSLTEMVNTVLDQERVDIDPDDTASYFDSSSPNCERLIDFVRHCELDSFFQMAINCKVQMLPLTKQLTNLAGNNWARTLNGGRAERNEYILLHEFHRQKFICPDKIGRKAAAEAKALLQASRANQNGDEENGESNGNAVGTTTSSKRSGTNKKYQGGLVFDPKRGLYDRFVLVMDFNSLYPSIIQEFNIDFTTVDRSDDDLSDVDKIPDVPSSDVSQGVLPRLIAQLVNRRREVKKLMKSKDVKPSIMKAYDIKQLALKLTANSMYGCLGFEGSRFYARPLAALTTHKGREILTHTKELATSLNLDVIYGDTDSVMINTNVADLSQAMKIGNDFKKTVNDKYKLLEIDIDAVFQRMLLLQKKKYAALKMESNGTTITEIKGLDMKRREYCQLSKNVSNYVLGQILSGAPTEVVVSQIHDYLTEIGNQIRESKIPLEDFIINKRLGKNPEDYPDSKNQPHVQVALRMKAKGADARSGTVIPYIFCLGEDGSSASKSAQADRAFHPDDLRKSDSEKRIDFEHYLALQILPPIERLCDSIEGTDRSRLAQCLGLDAERFKATVSSELKSSNDWELKTVDSLIPEEEKYSKCQELKIRCLKCRKLSVFEGIANLKKVKNQDRMITPEGIKCSNPMCKEPISFVTLSIQLDLKIRDFIDAYYEGWTICTEPNCKTRSRLTGVYARKCMVRHCRGKTVSLYSDKQLYTQLSYFEFLVDIENFKEKNKGKSSYQENLDLTIRNQKELDQMKETTFKYLAKSGRRYVDLGSMFKFMKV